MAEGTPESPAADGDAVWLPEPGDDPPVPAGARLLRGSADLPGAHLLDLVATMDRLRVECPWDARQTHQSLAPHLLEEPYEALDALESGDEQAFCEELGDVLLQVVFHARVAAERDDGTGYTIDDVADGIVAKLVRRHPHVFADVTVSGADEVTATGTRSSGKRRRNGPNGPGCLPMPTARRPRWTGCRSASPLWPWRRSFSAGRRGPGFLPGWRVWRRTTPGSRTGPATTSVARCSSWSHKPARRAATPSWSYARPRAATAIACEPGSVRSIRYERSPRRW